MFCRYCAAPIEDNARYCSKCGKDQFAQAGDIISAQNDTLPQVQNQQEIPAAGNTQTPQADRPVSAKLGPEIYRAGYNTKIKTRLIVLISVISVLSLGALVTALLFMFLPKKPDYVLFGMFLFMSIAFVFISSSSAKQLQVANKTFISVTQYGIFGSGGNAKYNEVQTFDLTFDRINKVSSLPNHLMIETGGASIYCLVENPKDVEAVIDRVMADYKKTDH